MPACTCGFTKPLLCQLSYAGVHVRRARIVARQSDSHLPGASAAPPRGPHGPCYLTTCRCERRGRAPRSASLLSALSGAGMVAASSAAAASCGTANEKP